MLCQICKQSKAHHSHHIVSKCFGGSNKKHNLVKVCSNCHHDIHSGNVIVEGYFQTSIGLTLFWHPKEKDSITETEDNKVYIINKKRCQ